MKVIFLEIDEVIAIHERMLKIGGGREGIRDFTLIHSAVERPKAFFAGKDLYPTVWLKAAALIHSLVKNHAFNDGNKRTGFFSTLRFLNLNGYDLDVEDKEIINFTLDIGVKKLNLEDISLWLKTHCRRRKK